MQAVLDVPFKIEQGSIDQEHLKRDHTAQNHIEQTHSEQDGVPFSPAMYPLPQLQWDGKQTLWLAVGNERGWSLNERLLFTKKHFTAYTMGRRILRTETAVTSAVAVCLALSGAWNMGNTGMSQKLVDFLPSPRV